MITARRVFQFTIGQGMAAIAAFAVACVFLPMPLAIILALSAALVVLRSVLAQRRLDVANPPREERTGCLAYLLGFLITATLAVILGGRNADPNAVDDGLLIIGVAICCGFPGALVAGTVAQLIALSRPGHPISPPDPSEANREAVRAEIDFLERLLFQGEGDRDEEVRTKLTAYKERLLRELNGVA